jgi:hypothetical protein
VQGYFFARPMPAENVPGFVTGWRGAEEIGALKHSATLLSNATAHAA